MPDLKRAIIRRPHVGMTNVVGIGDFDAAGERDVTLWVKGLQVVTVADAIPADEKTGQHAVDAHVNVMDPEKVKVLLHTTRSGRSDDALRLIAAQRVFEPIGVELELTMSEPTAPAAPAGGKRKAKE